MLSSHSHLDKQLHTDMPHGVDSSAISPGIAIGNPQPLFTHRPLLCLSSFWPPSFPRQYLSLDTRLASLSKQKITLVLEDMYSYHSAQLSAHISHENTDSNIRCRKRREIEILMGQLLTREEGIT
jgi:hypothetical protein